VGVLRAWDPAVGDLVEGAGDVAGGRGQWLECLVLDLPAAGHLLDDQLRVHPDRDRRGPQLTRGRQAGDQALVLGDVVGRDADAIATLRQQGPVLGEHHGAVAGRARVAA
jgi:hypothetical protein